MYSQSVDVTDALLDKLDFSGSGRVLEGKVNEFANLREKMTELAEEFEECEEEHIPIKEKKLKQFAELLNQSKPLLTQINHIIDSLADKASNDKEDKMVKKATDRVKESK